MTLVSPVIVVAAPCLETTTPHFRMTSTTAEPQLSLPSPLHRHPYQQRRLHPIRPSSHLHARVLTARLQALTIPLQSTGVGGGAILLQTDMTTI